MRGEGGSGTSLLVFFYFFLSSRPFLSLLFFCLFLVFVEESKGLFIANRQSLVHATPGTKRVPLG